MEDNFHLGIKALIRNSKGEILLLKINSKKLIYRDDWKGVAYWDIPGGRIKRNSTIKETLINEISEELGIRSIQKIKPFDMVLSKIRIPVGKDSVGLILAPFTCKIPRDSKIVLSEEHVEYGWFSPKEASNLLKLKYPKEFTEKIKQINIDL